MSADALPLQSGEGRVVVAAIIPGEPFPAQRPQWARSTGHMYMPKETTNAIRALRVVLAQRCPIPETALDVEVELVFRRSTRGRVDVDNLAKTVLDACKGIVWKDDSQVVAMTVVKLLGCGGNAGTTLRVSRCSAGDLLRSPLARDNRDEPLA